VISPSVTHSLGNSDPETSLAIPARVSYISEDLLWKKLGFEVNPEKDRKTIE
jgi:hypothetical protein